MRRSRRVKIVATLGPASGDAATVARLARAGADVFRINMSHASHDTLHDLVRHIRAVEAELDYPLGILVDLQGPKLRIGAFEAGRAELMRGEAFRLDGDPSPGNGERVHLPHPEILESVKTGDRLLLDDGKIQLRTVATGYGTIETEVIHGGVLSDRKGVSLPDTLLPTGALSAKDLGDLHAALASGADWIALSFVQRPEDVTEVRGIVQSRAGIVAKIEKPQAVERLEDIIRVADALMVARGDLGVELPLETVPGLQKSIILMARRYGRPVVVATQMLESMISAPVPTRAEVSDVSTAVFEGADAVMLSAESAYGAFPVESVATMDSIAATVERDVHYHRLISAGRNEPEVTTADAISAATRQVAETLDLSAIVTYTASGSTGLRAARERPAKPIIALSPDRSTVRRLSLAWGLHCVQTDDPTSLEDVVERACAIAIQQGFAATGDRIAITAGVPLGTPGATNMLRIARAGDA